MIRVLLSIGIGLAVAWVALAVVLLVAKPPSGALRESARIVPDALRLVKRLASDPGVHRGVRWRLWFLIVYLASPIDLIPDFVPVLGFADDAIVMSLVLRSVVKRAGAEKVRSCWSGTADGLAALARLCRLPELGGMPRDEE